MVVLTQPVMTWLRQIYIDRGATPEDYVVLGRFDTICHTMFGMHWRKLCQQAGVTLRFHDLRHLHASILLANGVPLTIIQHRLGHANVGITSQVYLHPTQDMQKEWMQRIEENEND
jgi:integrase